MYDGAPITESFCTSAEAVPAAPSACVLAVELTVTLPGKPAGRLRPGPYLYCGSARGPGGLRARLRRHMRRGKAIRWHIDRLTDGNECELVGTIANLPAPVAGFGSTDSRRCRSRLFRRPAAATPAVALRARARKDADEQPIVSNMDSNDSAAE